MRYFFTTCKNTNSPAA